MAVVPDSEGGKPDFIVGLEEFPDLLFMVNLLVRTESALQQELLSDSRSFHTVLEYGKMVYSKNR